MKRWLVLVALASCAKKQDEPPRKAEPMSAEEIKRAADACKAYVDKVCACGEKLTHECELARGYPPAVQMSVQVLSSPDSAPRDVQVAQQSVRATVKQCVEKMAKLPELGCP
jgi:hypothetical protein